MSSNNSFFQNVIILFTLSGVTNQSLIDCCCFRNFARNSLVALLEALCARIPVGACVAGMMAYRYDGIQGLGVLSFWCPLFLMRMCVYVLGLCL